MATISLAALEDRPYDVAAETAFLLEDLQRHSDRTPGDVGTKAAALKNTLRERAKQLEEVRPAAGSDRAKYFPWLHRIGSVIGLLPPAAASGSGEVSADPREDLFRLFLADCRAAGTDGEYLVWAIRE